MLSEVSVSQFNHVSNFESKHLEKVDAFIQINVLILFAYSYAVFDK